MTNQESQGQCSLCQQMVSNKAMLKHLQGCMEIHKNESKAKPCFHILVEGSYAPEYWLHIAIRKDVKLKQLDQFLRDIWLECCGHLSDFEIEGIRYAAFPTPELDQENMNKAVKSVLQQGMKFNHTYDYGSTTQLILKVIGEQNMALKKSVELLARNEMPFMACECCGKPATQVCGQCVYEDRGLVCVKCAVNHECGEDMMLPVVNSPRMGVCGYTGELLEDEDSELIPNPSWN